MNKQTYEYYPPRAAHAVEVDGVTDCGKCKSHAPGGQYFPTQAAHAFVVDGVTDCGKCKSHAPGGQFYPPPLSALKNVA